MHDCGGSEKAGDLPWELPRNDQKVKAGTGDILLDHENRIVICYDVIIDDFTRLARMGFVTKEELLDTLGDGDASVEFSLEWGE